MYRFKCFKNQVGVVMPDMHILLIISYCCPYIVQQLKSHHVLYDSNFQLRGCRQSCQFCYLKGTVHYCNVIRVLQEVKMQIRQLKVSQPEWQRFWSLSEHQGTKLIEIKREIKVLKSSFNQNKNLSRLRIGSHKYNTLI